MRLCRVEVNCDKSGDAGNFSHVALQPAGEHPKAKAMKASLNWRNACAFSSEAASPRVFFAAFSSARKRSSSSSMEYNIT